MLEATLADGRVTDTVHVSALRNAREEIDGVLIFGETAAERLMREATLHCTEAPYREIFTNAKDGLSMVQATGTDRLMCVDVNPRLRFVGRSRGELTGRHPDEIIPAELVKSHAKKVRRCMAAGERFAGLGRLPAATGPRWSDASGVVGMFRAIAGKMHMKAALPETNNAIVRSWNAATASSCWRWRPIRRSFRDRGGALGHR